LGLYKSLDGGVTWAAVTATGASCALQCWYDMALAVDPTNANIVYFSGFSLYKSVNGGTTFTDIGTSIHVDQHAVVFDPTSNTTIYAGSDGGVFKSTTGGTSWTTLNTSLNITQFYPGIAISPTSATTFIGGSQDNGTTEGGAALSWSSQLGGDGAMAAYDWKSGATFAGFTHGSSTDSPQRRDAGSSSWAVKNAGINTNDNANWVPPMTMDPRNPSVLYFGTNRVYRTSNSGDAWTAISPDLTSGGNLAAIAVAPSDSQTVYTGSSDGMVEVTTDLGLTWTPITTGLPVRSVTKIIVDPLDPRTAWLTVSGFSTGHVFKTVNGGRQWTDLSNNLPNDPASAIVLQAGSRELDVGTDIGVFALADGTTSWVPLMTGLPNVVITDLAYDGPRGRLVAGTHGRGIWTLPVATAVLRGNITNTGTLNPMDAQAILSAVAGKPLPAGYVRYPNGDANCDGTVTAEDALLVLMNLVGANTSGFCVGKNK
jgi:photosystem II stability/assembly factor-like uncharacterized protein